MSNLVLNQTTVMRLHVNRQFSLMRRVKILVLNQLCKFYLKITQTDVSNNVVYGDVVNNGTDHKHAE